MDVEGLLAGYREAVDRRLDALLPPERAEPGRLHSAMRYACLAPGKRLRPALCLASAEASGGRLESALDSACALEMIHAFSLIHDDLPAIDDDPLRRGLPSCHIEFGEALAILAGDALFALAFETVATSGRNADRSLRAVKTLARASGSDGLVGGEVEDVLSEGLPMSEAAIRRIHERKTAALIAASCEIGATLGCAADTEPYREFGRLVGLAFQVTDDVLNEISTAEALGKSAGSDRLRQKATYPALLGVTASEALAREMVESACALFPGDEAARLRALGRYAVDRLR